MNGHVTRFTENLKLGAVAQYEGLSLIPLSGEGYAGPHFLTLAEVLEQGSLVVTEVSSGGSVPELRAVNKGTQPVFIMDGEELAGAKQNRVLNTSLLLAPESDTVIPVSCTEQGRWTYTSPEFRNSGNVMFPSARAAKNRSVSASLQEVRGYRSNQCEVWEQIAVMHEDQTTYSSTGAMRDMYEQRAEELDSCEAAFSCQEGQIGFAAFINGFFVGLDVVACPASWQQLHAKVVRSYAVEARAQRRNSTTDPGATTVREFLERLTSGTEQQFPSPGLGIDLRYDGPGLLGSCLVVHDQVIHLALFPRPEANRSNTRGDRLATMSRRRSFRQGC